MLSIKTLPTVALISLSLVGAALAQSGSGPTTTPSTSTVNTGKPQVPGVQDAPKQYQPVNPAPDPRVAPTGTSSGAGSSSGGRPEQEPDRK